MDIFTDGVSDRDSQLIQLRPFQGLCIHIYSKSKLIMFSQNTEFVTKLMYILTTKKI